MDNQIVEAQEPPKTMMMQRKSRVHERIEEDEKELREMMAEREGAEQEAEVQAKEDAEPEGAEEKSYKKRYADLRRGSQKAKADLEARINALESQLKQSTAQEIKLPKSDEDIDAWASQYPDVAAIVETIAIKKAREQQVGLQDKVKEIDAMRESATREKAEVELLKAHPDFDDLRNGDPFHDWAEEQPKWVKDALYENMDDPASVVRVIDLYKSDNGLTKDRKKATSKAAATSIARGSRTKVDAEGSSQQIKESDVARMSAAEFEKREETITDAMRNGKFVYDMTGSAR